MAGEFGWHPQGLLAFGVHAGYPLTAEKLEAGNSNRFALRFAVNGACKAAAKNLNAQKLAGARWRAEGDIKNGGVLVAVFAPASDFYARSGFHTLVRAAADELAAQNLLPPDECPLCGLTGCDCRAFLDGEWRGAHRACLETRLDLPETDTTPPRRAPGHLATGILGALAGALVAGVLIWTLAMTQDKISWALYAFIPILSGLLYRTFRGKANANAAALCVLVASLLVTFTLEQVWYQVVLSAEVHHNVPFALSIPTYFRTHSFPTMLREMLACLLAMLAGFVATTVILKHYTREEPVLTGTVRGKRFILRTAEAILPAEDENATKPKEDT